MIYTPQQNGLAEKMNKTILERVRCMLLTANLPKSLWGEAVNTTAYLINRCPSTALNFKVPEEIWSGVASNFKNIKVFGCVAYAYISQGKLEPRARKCMFVGYPDGVKGYKLWYLDGNVSKMIISRDVVFRESKMYMNQGGVGQKQSIASKSGPEQVELEISRNFGDQENEPED